VGGRAHLSALARNLTICDTCLSFLLLNFYCVMRFMLNEIFKGDQLWRMRWAGHVTRKQCEKCVQNFGRKAQRNGPLGRHTFIREDNSRMNVRETG
jgi:hypothetical protein